MNKQTPAPWVLCTSSNEYSDTWFAYSDKQGKLFEVSAGLYTGVDEQSSYEEAEANAKLIAAAPELFENEVKNLEFLEWLATKASEFNMWSDKVQQLRERISLTKAAIKKATE